MIMPGGKMQHTLAVLEFWMYILVYEYIYCSHTTAQSFFKEGFPHKGCFYLIKDKIKK